MHNRETSQWAELAARREIRLGHLAVHLAVGAAAAFTNDPQSTGAATTPAINAWILAVIIAAMSLAALVDAALGGVDQPPGGRVAGDLCACGCSASALTGRATGDMVVRRDRVHPRGVGPRGNAADGKTQLNTAGRGRMRHRARPLRPRRLVRATIEALVPDSWTH